MMGCKRAKIVTKWLFHINLAPISLLMTLIQIVNVFLCHLLNPKGPPACFDTISMEFMGHKRSQLITMNRLKLFKQIVDGFDFNL